nr:tetraacyldisaccharide 4'-kinase [Roseovarius autotrophicus]
MRAHLLAPLGWWRARAMARRMARPGWRAPVPVIAVDSLLGGDVLPAVLALAGQLEGRGLAPVILMPGKGAARRVQEGSHGAADVGADGLLAAAFAPTWVAGDLAAGARAIAGDGAAPGCILLVGGFHDPALFKALSVIVVDAAQGFGNGFCRPAGPLQEPLSQSLRRADLLLSVGPPALQSRFAAEWGRGLGMPLIMGRMEAMPTGMDWSGLRALALSGAGEPGHFLAALRGLGAEVTRAVTLPEDQALTPALVTRLMREAALRGAQIVTTEASAVLLPVALRREVLVLPMRLRVAEWSALDEALTRLGA